MLNRLRADDNGSKWLSLLNPFVVMFLVVGVMNILVVPIGMFFDSEAFHRAAFGLDDSEIMYAYWWTVFAFVVLLVGYYVLGVHKNVVEYQRRPTAPLSKQSYRILWVMSFGVTLILVLMMWVQAGFRVPLLAALGTDFQTYSKLRTDFFESINQVLFYVTLYWCVTGNVVISFFHLRGERAYQIASAILFLATGCFTLARSPLGLAVLILLNYLLLSQKIAWRPVLWGLGAMVAILLASHYLAGEPSGYDTMSSYLGIRVLYGQWTALPHYFTLFANDPVSPSLMLPASFQGTDSNMVEGPSRLVMMRMAPEAVYLGTAGVACTFFIGEAFAVAGFFGVVVSPLFVAAQMWLITWCFRSLEKNTLTVFLYAWFVFKVLLGLISGFSAFLFSSLQIMLLAMTFWAWITFALGKGRRRARDGVPA